jgi:hypothetical protein
MPPFRAGMSRKIKYADPRSHIGMYGSHVIWQQILIHKITSLYRTRHDKCHRRVAVHPCKQDPSPIPQWNLLAFISKLTHELLHLELRCKPAANSPQSNVISILMWIIHHLWFNVRDPLNGILASKMQTTEFQVQTTYILRSILKAPDPDILFCQSTCIPKVTRSGTRVCFLSHFDGWPGTQAVSPPETAIISQKATHPESCLLSDPPPFHLRMETAPI